ADEPDGRDVPVVENGIDGFLVAVDDIEDAGGQASLHHQLGEHQRHGRVTLGRLHDEGVAAGDGRGELPQRDHGGEVERGDSGDDPERLAHGVDVYSSPGALGELALHQVWYADGELDHLD